MIIKQQQIIKLNEYLKEDYISSLSQKYFQPIEKIKPVVNEALSFEIVSRNDVDTYVKLYFKFLPKFEMKPDWMKYVLSNDYSAIDKLNYITKKLNS